VSLTRTQKLVALRALLADAEVIWQSDPAIIAINGVLEDNLEHFRDAAIGLCEMGQAGRTMLAILNDEG